MSRIKKILFFIFQLTRASISDSWHCNIDIVNRNISTGKIGEIGYHLVPFCYFNFLADDPNIKYCAFANDNYTDNQCCLNFLFDYQCCDIDKVNNILAIDNL